LPAPEEAGCQVICCWQREVALFYDTYVVTVEKEENVIVFYKETVE
jgi:hypothetical protein